MSIIEEGILHSCQGPLHKTKFGDGKQILEDGVGIEPYNVSFDQGWQL